MNFVLGHFTYYWLLPVYDYLFVPRMFLLPCVCTIYILIRMFTLVNKAHKNLLFYLSCLFYLWYFLCIPPSLFTIPLGWGYNKHCWLTLLEKFIWNNTESVFSSNRSAMLITSSLPPLMFFLSSQKICEDCWVSSWEES